MTDIVEDRIDRTGEVALGAGAEWTRVCRLDDLTPGRGAPARVAGRQVAIFRLPDERSSVYALGNRCPFSGAHVMARGLVGDAGGVPKVASPVYKQGFDLRTGVCLDDPDVSVPSYPVRVGDDGWIAVAVAGS
jgi:nitrite reductase (NADH) small subunit